MDSCDGVVGWTSVICAPVKAVESIAQITGSLHRACVRVRACELPLPVFLTVTMYAEHFLQELSVLALTGIVGFIGRADFLSRKSLEAL